MIKLLIWLGCACLVLGAVIGLGYPTNDSIEPEVDAPPVGS
jgi:hypothetical protein